MTDALPDRYAEAGITESDGGVVTDNFAITLSLLCQAGGIASMAMALNLNSNQFTHFAHWVLIVLGQQQVVDFAGIFYCYLIGYNFFFFF